MNTIDKIIGYFSPTSLERRLISRARIQGIKEGQRLFDGATSGRRGSSMPTQGQGNPNYDLGLPLTKLKLRSRYLFRNNSYGKRSLKAITQNVVGTGIQCAPTGGSDMQNESIKKAFNAWARSKRCDFHGKKNFFGIQRQVMQTVAMDGEVLVIKRRVSSDRRFPLKLQLVNCDYLDTTVDSLTDTDEGNFITKGIEFDSEGRVVAYHIYRQNPEDINSIRFDSERIPASEVLHIFEQDIIGQTRGIPFLAVAMLKMSDLDGYEDAQLMRQKVAACFSVFITGQPNISGIGGEEGTDLERVEPGIVERLAPGETIAFASPPPADGYKDYTTKVQESLAAGIGIAYSQLTGDLSNVNFSSARMGFLEVQKQFEDWQYFLMIDDFCQPVFEWFLEISSVLGANIENITAEWTPRGRFMIDPNKETNAKKEQLKSGIRSWSSIIREMGYNPDQVYEEIKKDKERLKDLGLDWIIDTEESEENEENTEESEENEETSTQQQED